MTETVKQTPTWQIVLITTVLSLGIFAWLMQKYESGNISFFDTKADSTTANKVKTHLQAMADSLIVAEKTGDRAAAIEVLGAVTKVINEFNDLPDDSKNRVLSSELRYCHLASLNLSEGAQLVYEGNNWLTKDRFSNALNMCH